MSDILDFIIIDLPNTFIEIGNVLFTPFVDLLEDTFGLNVPEVVGNAIGDLSLVGMISIGFIVSVLLFKLIALIIPN